MLCLSTLHENYWEKKRFDEASGASEKGRKISFEEGKGEDEWLLYLFEDKRPITRRDTPPDPDAPADEIDS
jgi:hypothetical protein